MGKGRAPTALEYELIKKRNDTVYRLTSDTERAKNRSEIRGISFEQAMKQLKK